MFTCGKAVPSSQAHRSNTVSPTLSQNSSRPLPFGKRAILQTQKGSSMNISIIGLGLIGGSLARAVKEYTTHKVFGSDLNDETLRLAESVGAIDGICTPKVLSETDVLILALYPAACIRYLSEHASHLPKHAVVLDTCGVKECVCTPCEDIAREHGFTFIGCHPMAGVQFSGFEHSRASLFAGASMILCPSADATDAVLQTLSDFIRSLGFGKICLTTPFEHDAMIAYTSQLAHVVSNAYIKSPHALKHRGFSAGSFRDLTRVARLNPDMWTELFFDNRAHLTKEIDNIIENLKVYRDALTNGDREAMRQALKEGSDLKVLSEQSKN